MWGLCKQTHSREGVEGAGQSVEMMRHGGLQRDIMCSCGGEGGAVCVCGGRGSLMPREVPCTPGCIIRRNITSLRTRSLRVARDRLLGPEVP